MTLIKSISGIRGTIGGTPGENLTPLDAVKFASAYGTWLKNQKGNTLCKVVIGRDARPSGEMVQNLVQSTLTAMGIHIIDCGLSTTPTVEMAVVHEKAQGGIILTASHNPVQWNALKLLNHKGEFLSGSDGEEILKLVEQENFEYCEVENLGTITPKNNAIREHIRAILNLPFINVEAITRADFKVAVDSVNSTGGLAIPPLLEVLGVRQTELLYCEPTGQFPHNPEPLKKHLGDIMEVVKDTGCDIGIVVDPDVDRLAFVMENGDMFGEEYTLVAAADYLLEQKRGPLVSNLSSSRALRDLALDRQQKYYASAVGEVNVVEAMKKHKALLGGEGNGGVILPDLHYGRDALVGIAMVLSHLAVTGKKLSELRAGYSEYYMAKNKASLTPEMDVDALLKQIAEKYAQEEITTIDGVKIDFENEWVHLRKSNTEPIVRVYAEAKSQERADALAQQFSKELEEEAQ